MQRHTEAVAANLASHASHAKADLDQHGLVSLRGIIAAEYSPPRAVRWMPTLLAMGGVNTN